MLAFTEICHVLDTAYGVNHVIISTILIQALLSTVIYEKQSVFMRDHSAKNKMKKINPDEQSFN